MVNFIDTNADLIIRNLITKYQELSGKELAPADLERIFIDVLVYREIAFRIAVNTAMARNFVQTATGTDLDRLSNMFVITRIENETDVTLRERILNRNRNFPGTKKYYEQIVKDLQSVSDVVVESKWDNSTIPYGYVRITPIKFNQADGYVFGSVPNTTVQNEILALLQSDTIGVIGVEYMVALPVSVLVNGSVAVFTNLGYNETDVANQVNEKIDTFFGQLSLSFTSVYSETDLYSEISEVEGVRDITAIAFSVPVLAKCQFYKKGTVTLSVN